MTNRKVELIKQLVNIPSPSGNTGKVIQLLKIIFKLRG